MTASERKNAVPRHDHGHGEVNGPAVIDVLGIGCAAVDDLLFVEAYPAADDKARVVRSERQGGGLTATALIAAARLGANCSFAGVLGDDGLSRFVRETLESEGVDTRLSPCSASARPVHSRIVVDMASGSRNIFFEVQGQTGAHANEPPDSVIQAARVLFIDGYGPPGTLRAARLAREAGVPVVADFEMVFDELPELLELVNHLILSRGFARSLSGADQPEEAARKLWRGPGHVVAITDGFRGCHIIAEDGAPHFQPAIPVKAVDTTGCGDVFHGAYAAALAQGAGLANRFKQAAVAAGLKATQAGGQRGIPFLEDVEGYVGRNG